LAFACMVTHTKGTGGNVCGPIIRDLLDRIAPAARDSRR
jgi:hypothetical protein